MRLLVFLLAVIAVSFCYAHAQAPPVSVVRVDVRLVQVDTQVINKKTHRALTSLRQNDFQVYEDGVQQEISYFSQDQLPISIVLLFDLTDSVRPVLKQLADGALESLQHLKPEDEVAVMTYSASAQLLQGFTRDHKLAASAIEKAGRRKSYEAAFFNEAIFQAASELERSAAPGYRRVILWLTDDVPNIPTEEIRSQYGRSVAYGALHTQRDAMAKVSHAGVLICTLLKRSEISEAHDIFHNSAHMAELMLYPPGEVGLYAHETGGEVLESSAKQLQKKLAQLIDDIRLRYTLGYHPSATRHKGRFCAIKVKLSPDLERTEHSPLIEARRGYYR